MTAALAAALGQEGLGWLLLGVTLAGLVRGFSGFGTAMVYLPFAGAFLPPVWALTTLVVMDVLGPLPNVPRALRDGEPRDVLRLTAGAMIGLPAGVALLVAVSPDAFRFAVSLISLALLALLALGVRYRGPMGGGLIVGTGAVGGVLGGIVGLAGPPVIMLYMASTRAVAAIRANILLYLVVMDVLMIGLYGLTGLLVLTPVLMGLMLAVPYLLANMAGAAMFRPERGRAYRAAAYTIIAVSAAGGLPLWD